jgi:hypothetical protein
MDADEQADALRRMCLPYEPEYRGATAYKEGVERRLGPGYGRIESMALHGVLRSLKPQRVIEIGSGVSTHCVRVALDLNRGETGREASLTCVEPYPSAGLRSLPGITLLPQVVQDVPLETFESLGENDLLFIDSSHVVKVGGDVNYLFLEVLPRLAAGVVVHVHDIFFPYDYQRDALKNFLHANESTLLQAYLAFNDRVRVLFCMSLLHYDRPDVLREVFPDYHPRANDAGLDVEQVPFRAVAGDFPSSIYLRVSGG